MDRRRFISHCAIGALGLPLGVCLSGAVPALASETGRTPHWAYAGSNGPANWGKLSSDFAICGVGSQQSPIDLNQIDAIPAQVGPLGVAYKPTPLRIVNNGHTIQVNYPPGSTVTVHGHTYELLQFHFHAPSEHTRGGKHYDMELHLVHQNAAHNIAVLGVLLQQGPANPALDVIWRNMPAQPGPERSVAGAAVDASRLVPESRSYFTYLGSLTTPPCTEGVRWVVLAEPASVSQEQIAQFRRVIGTNARPLQELDQRFVLEQL